MFESLLEECVALPEAALDERLRANELELRRLAAERAALVGVIEQRGVFSGEHRSMAAYLRATVNCSTDTASRERKLARLLTAHPSVGDTLMAGHITVDAAMQICRVQNNPRVREWLGVVIPVLVELAEHSSHRELSEQITNLIAQLDDDGAFRDTAESVDGRHASVVEVGGTVVMRAHGGDPIQAMQLQAIFDAFVEREYRADLEASRETGGVLPRTAGQRGFDALVEIFAAAAASPEGSKLPEVEVQLIVDERRAHEALTRAGLTLPGGDHIDLDERGHIANEQALLDDLTDELADDPEAFLRRYCETANGSPVHASVMLRALLTGHVRRVVMDSRGVVIDYGTRQRLFAGLARQAAMLLMRTCEFPGCDLPSAWSQIDHNAEWHEGGRTDQRNRNIGCAFHNPRKHRERWRTRRDKRGRAYTLRSDGTIILPVGERPPDLSDDEMYELARRRIDALVADAIAARAAQAA